jgi:membrane-bound lytic murein transglycosylase A
VTRVVAAILAVSLGSAAAASDLPLPARPVGFGDLAGWADDDHLAALQAFRTGCRVGDKAPAVASARPPPAALEAACADAARAAPATGESARAFFEARFRPFEVAPAVASGFLTGYFEPEFEGSLERTAAFATPLLAAPQGIRPGWPERAAIEDGALGELARPIVFLNDPVSAFIVHVQGSARIRLPDGRTVRVGYDGRNGHPYTSIGRVLALRLGVPPSKMNAERLWTWLRANPVEAAGLMRENRSYIFFRILEDLEPERGPIGAGRVPLQAGRSLAIDRNVWTFGLPIWLEAESERLARLTIAQDTGAAIVGPGRADLFVGSGAEAGARAGSIRAEIRFVVLWPKEPGEPGLAP